jgi:hypothetical protein
MLQIKFFGTTPPCANCKRGEKEALAATDRFPGQVVIVHLDALGPEAQAYRQGSQSPPPDLGRAEAFLPSVWRNPFSSSSTQSSSALSIAVL